MRSTWLKKIARQADRISIYHEQIAKCHLALGNTSLAIDGYTEAINKCSNDKYKRELEKRFNLLTMNDK